MTWTLAALVVVVFTLMFRRRDASSTVNADGLGPFAMIVLVGLVIAAIIVGAVWLVRWAWYAYPW